MGKDVVYLLYYGLITAAVAMFSVQFFFNQQFEHSYGGGLRSMLVFSAGSGLAGLIVLLTINGFRVEFSPFALVMATLASLNSMAYNFCSLQTLGKINLSLYSVFAMLGGMVLPFIGGICLYGEPLTLGKVICFLTVGGSLFLTVKKGQKTEKKFYFYYAGIFVLNGLSGVFSKIYQEADYAKISAAGYSILIAAVTLVVALAFLPFVHGEKRRMNPKAAGSMFGYGILSRVANWLLVLALAHLPASAQYPFVTGGVMILSTAIAYLTPSKPDKRELAAVALSFAGLLILVFVP